MKTLVLGGSSFVGKHLVRQLISCGHDVTVLNRGITPSDFPAGVRRLTADRKDHQALRDALAGLGFDAVFDNSAYVREDVEPLIDIFRGRLSHYVFTSTSATYVRATQYPVDETFELDRRPGAPPYGLNKVHCEDALFRAFREERFPVTAVRPSMVYGPDNNRPDREFAYFLRLRAGRPITVPGNGSGLLHNGHVDDLAAAMVAVLGNSRAIGEAYNVMGPKAVNCRLYVETLARLVGVEPHIVYVPLDRMQLLDPAPWPYPWQWSIVYDISKAMAHLDWKPRYSFEEGLRQTYEWFVQSGLAETMAWDWDAEERILTAATADRAGRA